MHTERDLNVNIIAARIREDLLTLSVFIAHYKSPDASSNRAKGLFEFDSSARLGSKGNMYDARIRMLEMFGNDALGWSIEKIEKKTSKSLDQDGQLELDFRKPIGKKRKKKREYW